MWIWNGTPGPQQCVDRTDKNVRLIVAAEIPRGVLISSDSNSVLIGTRLGQIHVSPLVYMLCLVRACFLQFTSKCCFKMSAVITAAYNFWLVTPGPVCRCWVTVFPGSGVKLIAISACQQVLGQELHNGLHRWVKCLQRPKVKSLGIALYFKDCLFFKCFI